MGGILGYGRIDAALCCESGRYRGAILKYSMNEALLSFSICFAAVLLYLTSMLCSVLVHDFLGRAGRDGLPAECVMLYTPSVSTHSALHKCLLLHALTMSSIVRACNR